MNTVDYVVSVSKKGVMRKEVYYSKMIRRREIALLRLFPRSLRTAGSGKLHEFSEPYARITARCCRLWRVPLQHQAV